MAVRPQDPRVRGCLWRREKRGATPGSLFEALRFLRPGLADSENAASDGAVAGHSIIRGVPPLSCSCGAILL